jgi:hypothetical protein
LKKKKIDSVRYKMHLYCNAYVIFNVCPCSTSVVVARAVGAGATSSFSSGSTKVMDYTCGYGFATPVIKNFIGI